MACRTVEVDREPHKKRLAPSQRPRGARPRLSVAQLWRESRWALLLMLILLLGTYCFNVVRLQREIRLHRQPPEEGDPQAVPH